MYNLVFLALVGCLLTVAADTCQAAGSPKIINERILVIHSTPPQKEEDTEKRARTNAYDGIVEQFTDKGYRIIDKASAEQCSVQIAATHEIDPLLNRAAAYGLKFFAEYTIYFKTSTIAKDQDDSKGALVKISSRVIDNTSSQVIASKTADASSAGFSVDDAIEKASRAAGKKLAGFLIGSLEKYLAESRDSGRIYTVVVEEPSDQSKLLEFLTVLERNPVIVSARETESGGGKCTYEVVYRGKRDQLDRDLLNAAAELGWKLNKVRAEGNRSTWKIH